MPYKNSREPPTAFWVVQSVDHLGLFIAAIAVALFRALSVFRDQLDVPPAIVSSVEIGVFLAILASHLRRERLARQHDQHTKVALAQIISQLQAIKRDVKMLTGKEK